MRQPKGFFIFFKVINNPNEGNMLVCLLVWGGTALTETTHVLGLSGMELIVPAAAHTV